MNKNRYMPVMLLVLPLILVALDQITKYYIVKTFALHTGEAFINNFFSFYYTQNTGSAFSFLADKPWGIYVLSGISTALAVAVFVFLIKSIKVEEYLVAGALSLLFAGAVGNLIDRFRLHYVIDFIRFDFGSWTFPIFNVADICAVLGTFMLIAIMLFMPKRVEKVW